METFRPPGAMVFNGNLKENWLKWKKKFNNFLLASEKNEKTEPVKIAILLNLIGDEGENIYSTFTFDGDEAERTLDAVIKKFESYCLPQSNEVFERFKFFSCSKKEGQNIDSYVTELKTLATSCNFGDQETSLIRDRIVLGVNDHGLQERLLREPKLTLQKAMDNVRACEISRKQVATINDSISNIDAINRNSTRSHTMDCQSCGRTHIRGQCPAYNRLCNKCKRKNHFAAVCKGKFQPSAARNSYKTVNVVQFDDSNRQPEYSDSNVNLFIDSVHDVHSIKCNEWIKVISVEGQQVSFKIDTGAQVNVLPLHIFKTLNLQHKVTSTDVVLMSYGNNKLKPIGSVDLVCSTEKYSDVLITFIIIDVKAKPILGLEACENLQLVRYIDSIFCQNKIKLIENYKSVFEGLGNFPGEPHHMEVKPDVSPVINAPRRVPQSLHKKLNNTLIELEKLGIISQVNKPTDWVNSLVVVEKPNGKLRICIDPRNLNKAIKREHHIMPSADEIIHRLEGKQCFSVLDLKDGFWQISLDDQSSELCTFNSPFGRFKFNKLPQGVCSAPEVFQKKNQKMFGDIHGVEIYYDDLIIAGKDEKEHNRILIEVLERAKANNIKFNPDKFQFKVSEVKYMGFLISKSGIRADPSHIRAIVELEKPSCKSDIKRLLGMVNFLSKFIPNVSTVTSPLRSLLKNDVDFEWGPEQKKSFDNIKMLICSAPVLKVFNETLPITLQCDSSKDGLGACLLQEGHPVAFASRSLTDAEQNYAQIEKELLAIVFAFQKYHNLIYGHKVVVESDHKPLTSIVLKPISKISSRLQRMLLRLLKYDFTVKYLPGSKMYVADTLSRAYIKEKVTDDPDMFNMVHSISKLLPMSENRFQQFQKATREDDELKLISQYYQNGWPENSRLPKNLTHYYKLKNDVVCIEGLVFLNDKIIIPRALRHDMLLLIHESHLGIQKCKSRAREIMYWPGINRDIENIISKCSICEKFQKSQCKEPLIPHEIPSRPFQRIGIDIMYFRNADYLVLIDYYSKWIETVIIQNKTSVEIIVKLEEIFSRFGIPETIICDNVPFNSFEFKNFGKGWDIEIIFTSPNYSQSNGMVEKAVGICKTILKKAFEDNRRPSIGLLEYRNTPISGLDLSPAQLMFNRRLRTKLPISNKLLNPELFKDVDLELLRRQQKQKLYYDKASKTLKELKQGDKITVQNVKTRLWEPAIVLCKTKNPRSYKIKTNAGRILIRNRKFLKLSNTSHPYLDDTVYDLPEGNSLFNNVTSNQISNNTHDQGNTSRTGRIIKRPQYLNDYVCN